MNTMEEILSSFLVELKRGTLVLSVLSQLSEKEYGYSLVQKLEEKGVPIEPGTLYPLLRRLEKQELLTSEWDTTENRPRKFYVLSEKGRRVFTVLRNEWLGLTATMDELLKEGEKGWKE